MKLKSFNIQNYRSIINSGWSHLAYDNITALIGQNESGKTSVLEGLQSFYEGKISDDVLRSDLTFPVVSCSFDLEGKKIFDFLDQRLLPAELKSILENKTEIAISREWIADKTSKLKAADPDVLKYYESIRKEQQDLEERVQQEINEILEKSNSVFKDTELAENEKQEIKKQLSDCNQEVENARKSLRKARKQHDKLSAQKELDAAQDKYSQKEVEYNKKIKEFEDLKIQTQDISEKARICKACNDTTEAVKTASDELNIASSKMKDAEHIYDICSSEKEKRSAYQKLRAARYEFSIAIKKHRNLEEEAALQKIIADKIFNGAKFRDAEEEARKENEKYKKFYTVEDIGKELFKYIPVFEFFEDFASLLPNKIDLEDLLTENSNCEGYKAAKNFLKIAGLDADFFREKNHRILKQKIENLNGEITINFQDYWRQNVGKDNKIRLNFELEHYDYTVPEKSGKPYLEFWIKDKQERLYPKQRSRGVRWFLSFYLELKATASKNKVNRVLLIDEPGLSLHARAQEDVLIVFEDLKENMQIIYSTHSPHLVNIDKLYRILAVQRTDENIENSDTIVLDTKSLYSASSDTLSPIYSLMGTRLNEQQFIQKKNNIIIEDTVTYYYINTVASLLDFNDAFFLPATGVSNIPVLTNILIGWKLDFIILTTDNDESKKIRDMLKKTYFVRNEEHATDRLVLLKGFRMIEDMFSAIDFKKFILHQRIGITETISDYIETNDLSRTILASEFVSHIQDENVKFSDFDPVTQKNFKSLFDKLQSFLK